MRIVTVHPDSEPLNVNADRLAKLKTELDQDILDALAARGPWEEELTECLRQYEGVPKTPERNIPIQDAPNIEVTLGAIAADSVYARVIDLVFNQVTPTLTCRAGQDDAQLADDVKRFQTWTNHVATVEMGLRPVAENVALDWNQIGTGCYFIPFTDTIRKTLAYKIQDCGPKAIAIPIEDCLWPGGAMSDVQTMPWFGIRFWMLPGEVEAAATANGWDITGIQTSSDIGWVRSRREMLGKTTSNAKLTRLYQIQYLWKHYDIDGDGTDEELLVIRDHTSQKLLKVDYNPYDMRPIEIARYQKRAHMFPGLGILGMMKQYQEALTENVCDGLINSKLANTRMFATRPNTIPGGNVRIWPGRNIEMAEPDSIKELRLSDIYPSNYRNAAEIISYAEQRVGVRELSGPAPSKVLGGRTPGITALSVLQQTNQRFVPAFDDFRFATAGAVRQGIWRYREQLKAGGAKAKRAKDNIIDVLGEDDAERVIGLLLSDRFEEQVRIELTASSPQLNKAQERQDAIQLGQIMMMYYEKSVQLVQLASQPGTPKALVEVAKQIAEKVGEFMDRTVRAFEPIRDPSTFLIDFTEALDSIQADAGVLNQLQALMQQGGQNGAPPPGNGPPLLGSPGSMV
ncbi:MAG TPA: hypothetical protein VMU39_27525 [Solirubrobacteraceae bacterium]|nr:hypothetical protein [Solirubrobacteraceae bacterium]